MAGTEVLNKVLFLDTVDSFLLIASLKSHWSVIISLMMRAFTWLTGHATGTTEEALLQTPKTLLLRVLKVDLQFFFRFQVFHKTFPNPLRDLAGF